MVQKNFINYVPGYMDLMKKQNSYGTWKKIVPLGELNLVLPGKNQMTTRPCCHWYRIDKITYF